MKDKKVEIPYMYLHKTLSNFLLAKGDVSRRIVPTWEDGSNVDIDPGPDSPESEDETVVGSGSEVEEDQEWVPGNE